jgi:hypothetical protein
MKKIIKSIILACLSFPFFILAILSEMQTLLFVFLTLYIRHLDYKYAIKQTKELNKWMGII